MVDASRMVFAKSVVLLAGLCLSGCEGPVGPAGPTGPTGPQGEAGARGDDGAAGEDGQDGTSISIYGDGSLGPLIVANDSGQIYADWVNEPPFSYPSGNQFTDCDIQATQWRVPSGTVIRCTGSFSANSIIVEPQSAAGAGSTTSWPDPQGVETPLGGDGLSEYAAHSTLYRHVHPQGGNIGHDEGGIPTGLFPEGYAPYGGGVVRIYAGGAITIGDILADGGFAPSNTASGGGAGGMIVLLSGTSVTQADGGVLSASGAGGSDGELSGSPDGGGGGGGIIHVIAPSIDLDTARAEGGTGGTCTTGQPCETLDQLSAQDFGGSGGSFAGGGGDGNISTGGGSLGTASTDGEAGFVFTAEFDPEEVVDTLSLILR